MTEKTQTDADSEELADIVRRFNDCINAADLSGLSDLMTSDHEFVDSAGNSVRGKSRALDAWTGFFTAFPDYRNIVERLEIVKGRVVMTGWSQCSDERLDGAAIWVARVKRKRLSRWCVYEDTTDQRTQLGIDW